jgi:signal transduction histidine kinase/ActR/RegA family two-component response regulator
MAETVSKEEYDRLLENLRGVELENRKLARKMSANEKLIETFKVNINIQANVSKMMQAEKAKQDKYSKLFLSNCPDVIFILDQNMKYILGTNSVAELMSIKDTAILTGREFSAIAERHLPEGVRDGLLSTINDVVAPGQPFECRSQRAHFSAGDRRYEIVVASFANDENEFDGIFVLMHDSTELTAAKEAAEKANYAKSDFLATMSHEIRTPMNAIIGLQNSIIQEPLSQRQKNYMDNMKKSSYSLLSIINDILDFSKIEAGKITVEPSDFDLGELCRSIAGAMEVSARQKGLSFNSFMSPQLPRYIYGDENKIRQIITNILNNAVKYTNAGGIEFSAAPDGDCLAFTVKDTGIGIKEEDIGKLFSPFEQLDLRKNKDVVGTGLGLAISGRLCAAMNGSIKVESVYGEGSGFTVRLPCTLGERVAKEEDGPAFSAPAAKVLVVDDIDINLIVAEAILSEYGIQPDLANSGAKALELVQEKRYDLIFMDQMMPGMDGVETTKRLRSLNAYYAGAPVVALTANVMSGSAEIFEKAGFSDFVLKPIESPKMAQCLRRWLPKEILCLQKN